MSNNKENYLRNYLQIMEAYKALQNEKMSELITNFYQMMDISWEAIKTVGESEEIVHCMNMNMDEMLKSYKRYLSLQETIKLIVERK